jgi:predicted peroxiredoxin
MPVRGGVKGLTILLVAADPERFRAALALAAANAALGGRTRLFAQGRSVALLAPPIDAPDDPAHAAAGLPTLAGLIDEALGLGVEIVACQSGLALAGIDAASLDPRVTFGGPLMVLQSVGEDRLLAM